MRVGLVAALLPVVLLSLTACTEEQADEEVGASRTVSAAATQQPTLSATSTVDETPRDEAELKSLVERQAELFNNRNWNAWWEMYSPATRNVCTADHFASEGRAVLTEIEAAIGPVERFEVTDISIAVRGNTALASFTLLADGVELEYLEDDIWVKVDGRWYDVDENGSTCPDTGEGERG